MPWDLLQNSSLLPCYRILEIYFFCFWVFSHTVCLFAWDLFFLSWVSGGQRFTRRHRAPLEIPKPPRATRPPTLWGKFVCESGRTMAVWVYPPTQWGRFVCESGRTMALWVRPPAQWGKFVRESERTVYVRMYVSMCRFLLSSFALLEGARFS